MLARVEELAHLQVHGVTPGSKPEGIWRLKEIIDGMEADIVCYNEHRQNLMHKKNICKWPFTDVQWRRS
jgi:hypothetical protein